MVRMTKEWSDRELVDGMIAGDKVAWRNFAARYDALMYAAIDRVLRPFPALRTRSEREEIRAMLIMSLLNRGMHKLRVFEFDRGTRLSTWIGLLAANMARDYVRSAFRRPRLPTRSDVAETAEENGSNPLRDLLLREALTRASSTLQSLSSKDQQFLELLFVEGREPAEVALEMNISVKTVYSKKHKLVHRLQRVLAH